MVALLSSYLSRHCLPAGEGVAKIADVGMSRRMLSDLATAQAIMTPLWSAPEVLRRERASVKVRTIKGSEGWGPDVPFPWTAFHLEPQPHPS